MWATQKKTTPTVLAPDLIVSDEEEVGRDGAGLLLHGKSAVKRVEPVVPQLMALTRSDTVSIVMRGGRWTKKRGKWAYDSGRR